MHDSDYSSCDEFYRKLFPTEVKTVNPDRSIVTVPEAKDPEVDPEVDPKDEDNQIYPYPAGSIPMLKMNHKSKRKSLQGSTPARGYCNHYIKRSISTMKNFEILNTYVRTLVK